MRFPCVHAVATTPAQRLGVLLRSLHPAVSAFPDMAVGSACALSFSRFARRSLRYGLHTRAVTVYRDPLTEGFSHFVTSIAAPVASGWSARRVGFAPTGKRRLSTAHATSRLYALQQSRGSVEIAGQAFSSSSNAFASCRSFVSKPSVNQP